MFYISSVINRHTESNSKREHCILKVCVNIWVQDLNKHRKSIQHSNYLLIYDIVLHPKLYQPSRIILVDCCYYLLPISVRLLLSALSSILAMFEARSLLGASLLGHVFIMKSIRHSEISSRAYIEIELCDLMIIVIIVIVSIHN